VNIALATSKSFSTSSELRRRLRPKSESGRSKSGGLLGFLSIAPLVGFATRECAGPVVFLFPTCCLSDNGSDANALKHSKARSASLRKVKRWAWSIASSARHLDRARLHPPESSAGHALAEPACSSGEAQSCTSTDSSSRSMRRSVPCNERARRRGGRDGGPRTQAVPTPKGVHSTAASRRGTESSATYCPVQRCSSVVLSACHGLVCAFRTCATRLSSGISVRTPHPARSRRRWNRRSRFNAPR